MSVIFTASNAIVVLLGFAFGLFLKNMFFTVETSTRKVVQRWGKFHSIAEPGLNFKFPVMDQITDTVDMRIQQMDLVVETKTKDNTFVKVHLAVQYRVLDAEKAYYSLDDEEQQISAYVFDVVRSKVPNMNVDETFEKKNDIADNVKAELEVDMAKFGYEIVSALVTDIEPAEQVKRAMNDIVAAQREQIAATSKGEAQKILIVKQAEAEAESKKLQGEGIANQRKAIINGLQTSVEAFEAATKVEAKEVLQLVLITQYFDTLKDIGLAGHSNVIMMPHTPGFLGELSNQIQQSILSAKKVEG